MRITDHVDLFYPSSDKRKRASRRREQIAKSGSHYIEDLGLEGVRHLISMYGSDRLMTLAQELSDDIETINYRLDCLEDFVNNPELADRFRKLIAELSGRRPDEEQADINTFYEIRERMDELSFFLSSVEKINEIYSRIGPNIKSSAVKRLFEFFESLPQSEEFKSIAADLSALKESFSKTIRSVRVGINFNTDMTPDSAGLLEVSFDKIYPRGNILEKLVYGNMKGYQRFMGEEHLSSLTRHTPADIDSALFRELSEYTRDYAKRISSALKSYRLSFFTDISELEHQLDHYEGAAAFIRSAAAHGMKMCRPKLLPQSERRTVLKGIFDLGLYKELVLAFPRERLDDKLITNDLTLDEKARFFMVTGANNGGKTTFARAVGLCQVLAQAGLYVPAECAELSVCDNIFTHFPRDEQVGIDTSRFTNEIKDLKAIASQMTDKSLVILNESLQSTTPEECLSIAQIHLELFAAAGVRGLYVTHLTGLYKAMQQLNQKPYPTRLDSLVSVADEGGQRLYKLKRTPPSGESLAMTIYRQFGATMADIGRAGDSDEQA